MAIPSSGALALSAIQTEFGGANPISMSEYYAGGTHVPSGTSGVNGAVPTTGAISVSKFYGTTAVVVSVPDDAIYAFRLGSSVTATASFALNNNGTRSQTVNTTTTTIGDWVTPTNQAANYEVFATLSSGALTSGTTGSWLALTSTRSWTVSRSPAGISEAVVVLQVRKIGTTTVLASGTITLTAEREL